jgi:hypothetical protein
VRRAVAATGLCAFVLAGAARADRPDTPNTTELFHYAAGDIVETFPSAGGHFLLHFTRSGMNAVPADDADKDGTPDDVQESAQLYEQVLALYQQLGFLTPRSDANLPGDHGGDGRFDVYLLDFGGSADGSYRSDDCDSGGVCTGFMVQENDFAGYAYPSRTIGNRILASHEFFHAVQAAYNSLEGTIFAEGTAVWATETFDPTLNDFEGFVKGYLSKPDRSLNVPGTGPVDSFSYGAAIFFEFLDEKYGPTIIRELWESVKGLGQASPPQWFGNVDTILKTRYATRFADAYFEFTRWNLYTQKRANPMHGYARGSGYPLVRIDPGQLPLSVPSLRVFPAAAVYTALPPGGRKQVVASLVTTVDASSLRLALAVRRGDVVEVPVVAAAGSLDATADTDGADEVILLVANTAQAGESQRPTVCAGDADEVDACRVAAGAAPLEPAPTPEPAKSGGCSTTGTGGPVGGGGPLVTTLLALAFALRRRATRRT